MPARSDTTAKLVDFVIANTEITTAALVPEIRLHLASEVVPIWYATEEALAQAGVPPPYWAFCWPGSQALARFLLDRPDKVAGRRVLDLASGCGIAAIAATHVGARTIANDIDPIALAAITLNCGLNGVEVALDGSDLLSTDGGAWDLVLAGDVCYERPFAERAIAWLRRQAAGGARVLLADPGRAYLPSGGLEQLADYVVPTSLDLEDRTARECTVWRVLP